MHRVAYVDQHGNTVRSGWTSERRAEADARCLLESGLAVVARIEEAGEPVRQFVTTKELTQRMLRTRQEGKTAEVLERSLLERALRNGTALV